MNRAPHAVTRRSGAQTRIVGPAVSLLSSIRFSQPVRCHFDVRRNLPPPRRPRCELRRCDLAAPYPTRDVRGAHTAFPGMVVPVVGQRYPEPLTGAVSVQDRLSGAWNDSAGDREAENGLTSTKADTPVRPDKATIVLNLEEVSSIQPLDSYCHRTGFGRMLSPWFSLDEEFAPPEKPPATSDGAKTRTGRSRPASLLSPRGLAVEPEHVRVVAMRAGAANMLRVDLRAVPDHVD